MQSAFEEIIEPLRGVFSFLILLALDVYTIDSMLSLLSKPRQRWTHPLQ